MVLFHVWASRSWSSWWHAFTVFSFIASLISACIWVSSWLAMACLRETCSQPSSVYSQLMVFFLNTLLVLSFHVLSLWLFRQSSIGQSIAIVDLGSLLHGSVLMYSTSWLRNCVSRCWCCSTACELLLAVTAYLSDLLYLFSATLHSNIQLILYTLFIELITFAFATN